MKKAKIVLLYLVCFVTIGYLLVCAGAMGYSITDSSAYIIASSVLNEATDWYRNILCISAVAWLSLRYLEKPVHRRDLSGYALIPLALTVLWFVLRTWDHYEARWIHSLPWHFAVMIDCALFLPFLILEAVAFFFLRYRGKLNYPEEYQKKADQPKPAPRRSGVFTVVFPVVVIVLALITFLIFTQFGYRMELSCGILGYKASDDGSTMRISAFSPASALYVNQMEYEVDENGHAVRMRFYMNVSPYYRLISGDDSIFEVELPPDCTEIYAYDPQRCTFDLVLKLDEETGNWLRRRYDSEIEEYYFVYDDYFPEY